MFLWISNFQSGRVLAQRTLGVLSLKPELATPLGTTFLLFLVWVVLKPIEAQPLCLLVLTVWYFLESKLFQFSVCVFLFFLKDFRYAFFLDYRSVYTLVALSEPAYTQVSLVSVAYTRILQIIAGAYITLFSRFIIFLIAECFSGGLGQSQAVISPVTVPCLTGGILFWTLSSYKEC